MHDSSPMPLLLGIALLFSPMMCSETSKADTLVIDSSEAPVLSLNDEIDAEEEMQAELIEKLGAKGDLWLFINSEGGDVEVGYQIIKAIKGAKRVKCLVTGQALSMGFMILNACHERYALPNALFMFHAPRVHIRGGMTFKVMEEAAADLKKTDEQFRVELSDTLKLPDHVFLKFYNESAYFTLPVILKLSPGWITPVSGLQIN